MPRRFQTSTGRASTKKKKGSTYKPPSTTTIRKQKGRTYKPPTKTTISKPKDLAGITSTGGLKSILAPTVPTVTQPGVPFVQASNVGSWTPTSDKYQATQSIFDLGLPPGVQAPVSGPTEETLSPEVLKGFAGTQTATFGDYGLPPGVRLDADFKNQMAIAMNQFTGGAGAMTPSEWAGAYPGEVAPPYISDPTQEVKAPAGFEYLQSWFDNPQLQGAAFNVMQTSTLMSEFGIPPTMVTTAVRVGMGWTKYDMEDMGYIQDPLGNWFLEEDDAPLPMGDTGFGDGGASTGGYGRGTSLGRGYPSTYGGGGANLINWRIRI